MRKTKAAKPSATVTVLRADRPYAPRMPEAPPMPPLTELKSVFSSEVVEAMKAFSVKLHQRNLNNAVRLAQQAAANQGPLVEHFAELGRRFSAQSQLLLGPNLRLVEGSDGAGDAA